MRISIRNSVFETNSSSTHSFTIISEKEKIKKSKKLIKINKRIEELDKKLEENFDWNDYSEMQGLKTEKQWAKVSFEIKSPLAKLVWLKGLIDNAKGGPCEHTIDKESPEENYTELPDQEMQDILLKRLHSLKDANKKYLKDKITDIENRISKGQEQVDNLRSLLYDYDPNYYDLLQQYPQLVKRINAILDAQKKVVDEFYNLLKKEYCKIENITEDETDNKIIEEGNKCIAYERILKNKKNIKKEVENQLVYNINFRNFAIPYNNKVEAFRDFVKQETIKNCKNCKGRISCNRYFVEGPLDECYCGFDSYGAIYSQLEIAKKKLTFEEFAKVFITDTYSILGQEDWNHCILETDEIY